MEVSAYAYVAYGIISADGASKTGYEFGQLALQLCEKFDDIETTCMVYHLFGNFINHWQRPYKTSFAYLQKTQQMCLASGVLFIANLSMTLETLTHAGLGSPFARSRSNQSTLY